MEDTTSTTIRPSAATTNPPSVENAYKRKCLALKKRLNEIEEENEQMRVRNRRGWQYIQKMRLESCILLERLAKVTGMTEEASSQAGAAANPELRARAVALMSNASALNGLAASSEGKNGAAGGGGGAYLDDETEGSSDEQPPTPQERPLRVKRSRKSNLPDGVGADDEGSTAAAGATSNNAADNGDNNTDNNGTLPRLAPAPSQDDLSSTFRLGAGQHPESDERGTSQNPESGSRTRRASNAAAAAADDDDDDAAAEGEENENEAGDASVEPSSTPMDVDVKEPKEES